MSVRTGDVISAFSREFAREPEGITDAPGRVNLIGEHVDYNDGFVLPFAIAFNVVVAWARREDDAVWAYSLNYGERSRFNLANVTHAAVGSWANYVRGVADVLVRSGYNVGGLDLTIGGDVPDGAGLSSSAALEVAVMAAFRDACALSMKDVQLAQLCQRAENEFVGVQSGIMDQFASALSRRDHALLVDCRSLDYTAVPLRLAANGLTVVIANSAVRRELVSSAYNDRRRECEQAVEELRTLLGRTDLASLRDVSAEDLAAAMPPTPDVPLRRARHVVSEVARVHEAVAALERDDFEQIGLLMAQSHASLRSDYEVSSPQLDLLVRLASEQPYVLGARLTGAGFGGCTVNIVRTDGVASFAGDVIDAYRRETGRPAEMYVTSARGGLETSRV